MQSAAPGLQGHSRGLSWACNRTLRCVAAKRRLCTKCGKNTIKWDTPRQRVCNACKRTRTQTASRAVRLLETYGITEEDYAALLEAQGGVCAICGGRRSYNLDVDHSHSLERQGLPPRDTVRGLLCKQCNRRVLRSVRDDVGILKSAIAYLEDPPAPKVLGTRSGVQTDAGPQWASSTKDRS